MIWKQDFKLFLYVLICLYKIMQIGHASFIAIVLALLEQSILYASMRMRIVQNWDPWNWHL
jgi:hypothetical protein